MLTKPFVFSKAVLPVTWNPSVQDFITQLLEFDPKKRLGVGSIKEIKNHPWLSTIDWVHLKH